LKGVGEGGTEGPGVKNWLLTGRPGVGKTTLIRSILRSLNIRAGGFLTEEIREAGRRVGFRLRDLQGGEGLLAHVSFSGPHRVGKYGVRIETMEEIGIPALKKGIYDRALLVIDEIGRMELFSPTFQQAISDALDSAQPVLGVLQERASPFAERIKERKDTKIVLVTVENRAELLEEIREEMQARLHLLGLSH
jgi:nucleoside-triphosphatase